MLAIGLMSGTSLDGLDIAYCNFQTMQGRWDFELLDYATISYDKQLIYKLQKAINLNEEELLKLNFEIGKKFGTWVSKFIQDKNLNPDLISSHGHTIFHQPKNNYTVQIGSGLQICKATHVDTISDFRSVDVALNGEGAPLVPIGDKLLFNDFDYCLNLGGIANVSFEKNGNRIAYDICVCNMLLNFLAKNAGLDYDKDGILASTGKIIPEIYSALNEHQYYKSNAPKSIGIEWFNKNIIAIIRKNDYPNNDLLRTAVAHITEQINNSIEYSSDTNSSLLITGGGTHNKFLIDELRSKLNVKITVPSSKIIDYKEAIIFAFIGVLRKLGKENVLSTVTGSNSNHSAGTIYWAPN